MKHVSDGALLKETQPLAERRVLVLQRVGQAAAGRGIHPDITFVPRKGPEDQPLLHWLGYPRIPLLYPLEGQGFGDKFGGDVEKAWRRPTHWLPPPMVIVVLVMVVAAGSVRAVTLAFASAEG